MPDKDNNNNSKKYTWKPDKHVNKCHDCSNSFTMFTRRYHCRRCGNIFCDKCCAKFDLKPDKVTDKQTTKKYGFGKFDSKLLASFNKTGRDYKNIDYIYWADIESKDDDYKWDTMLEYSDKLT
ncbi:MAG: FYVE zinc finger domain-containing protein [Pseudomonadota bacterium]